MANLIRHGSHLLMDEAFFYLITDRNETALVKTALVICQFSFEGEG
ncbi:hypothetical protein [Moorena sp. SIO1G6]|nr:hypothetical protein [Moorena sp. SIO1G6]